MGTQKPDPAYHTVAREDFAVMIDESRFAPRSRHFEAIIARMSEHFCKNYPMKGLAWSATTLLEKASRICKDINVGKRHIVRQGA